MKIRLLAFSLTLTFLFKAVHSLRDVKVHVPEAVRSGSSTVMTCFYQLDGDALYTVKWYKSGREFYRFTPKEKPKVKQFPMLGVDDYKIEMNISNATHVFFNQTNNAMSGLYSCEVSADAPSFHTGISSGYMAVVEPPEGKPTLTGVKARYRLNELVQGNCSSPAAKPAANLTWIIKGKPVNETNHVKHYAKVVEQDKIISTSSIRLHVKMHHFDHRGQMRVKCVASIHNVYWQTTEKVAELIDGTARTKSSENDVVDDNKRGGSSNALSNRDVTQAPRSRSNIVVYSDTSSRGVSLSTERNSPGSIVVPLIALLWFNWGVIYLACLVSN